MIWRIELLPMSIAEMRTSRSASVLEVVLDLFSLGDMDGIFFDISPGSINARRGHTQSPLEAAILSALHLAARAVSR